MGAELFHAHRRTDMKLIVAFRNFANAPKNAHRPIMQKLLRVVSVFSLEICNSQMLKITFNK